MSGVETVNVRSAGTANIDLTGAGISGVTTLNSTQSVAATLTAATTTNINVSGATGAIIINGGKDISVTDATKDTDITIGATKVGAGSVSVTATSAGASTVAVDGGTSVTLNVTGTSGGADTITVGQGGDATDLPTGAVNVTSAHTGVAATDVTLNAITVSGGSTITVTQTADTSKAAADTTGATLTQGAVTVTAGTGTTLITTTQAASVKEVLAVTAVAGSAETASVKFGALKAGDTLTLDADAAADVDPSELTLTAAVDMTAAEVAAAFANLLNGKVPTAGDTQGGAPASKGTYAGASTLWTSAAASSDTVVFTSTTATGGVTDLAFVLTNTSTNSVAPTVTTTAGVSKVTGVTGVLGVISGTVVIDDNATAASVTSVSVNGYGATSTIGATNNMTKLASLTLANTEYVDRNGDSDFADNNESGDMTVNVGGALASLDLTLNKVRGTVTLTGAALKTLNLTATGADSSTALSAAAAETLTIAGDKSVTLSSGTFTALKTITVSGSAGAVFDGDEADTLTSVNTSATTGSVTAFIDGTVATYTGGAGKDSVSLVTGTALTKAIDLGAGDDTLSFVALNVTGSTAAVNGGEGTDILSMATATAAALDDAAQSFYTGFERLTINDSAGDTDGTAEDVTINLANLGLTNYVTTTGTKLDTTTAANADTLVLDNLATNGTVVITAAAAGANTKHKINIKDAATGTADVLNLVLSSASGLTAGTVTAAGVETVNLSTVDTSTTAANTDSVTLTATSATAVTVAGASALTLTMTSSTKVTSINASAATGAVTVTSLNTTSATTISGGSANDSLTAATGTTADVLIGGAGDDTLTANAGLTTLTGGAGNDVFVIGTASLNSSSYATITDFVAGDLIKFTGADSFAAAKVNLADTAVFQDYANAAVNAVGANDIAWFQYSGNTYIVMDEGTTNSTTFINGEDFIVRLTGLVDLTNASFNNTHDTIAL